MNSDFEEYLELSHELLTHFKKFRYLRNEQVYEILLSYYKLLKNNIVKDSTMLKYLRLLWYFIVRSRFISINPSDYEKIFVDLLLKYKGFSFLAEYADAAASALNETYTETFDLLIPQQISEYLVLGSSYNFQLGYVFKNDIGIDFRYEFSTPEFTNETNNAYENSILQDFENMSFGISKYFDNNNLKIQAGISSIKYFYGDETTIAELVCQIRL